MLSVLRARSNTVEALSPLFTPRVWASQYGAGPKCKDSFDHSSLDSQGLILDGLLEHSEKRGQKEVTYELVVDPPRRTVAR